MKKIITFLLCFLLILSLTGCSGGNSTEENTDAETAAEDSVITIRFSATDSEASFARAPMDMAITSFVENVEERSNGRVEIKMFYGGQLGSTAEQVITSLQTGAFEMGNWALGNFGEYTNAFMPMNLPYLFTSADEVYEFVDGPIGQKMETILKDDTQIKLLSYLDIGFRHITNSKQSIKTVEDVDGLKLRTMTDKYQMAGMEALGASPTPMAYSELYTALQQKVVDGQENPITNIYGSNFYEVQDYMTLTSHNYGFSSIIMSDAFFNSLPADIQEIITEEADAAEKLARELTAQIEAENLEEMKSEMDITVLTSEELKPFQEKAKSVWPMIEEEIGSDYYNEILDEIEKIQSK